MTFADTCAMTQQLLFGGGEAGDLLRSADQSPNEGAISALDDGMFSSKDCVNGDELFHAPVTSTQPGVDSKASTKPVPAWKQYSDEDDDDEEDNTHSIAAAVNGPSAACSSATHRSSEYSLFADGKVAVRFWDKCGTRAVVELKSSSTGRVEDFSDKKASTHGSNVYALGKVQGFCYDCEYTFWGSILLKDKVRSPVLRTYHHCLRSGTKSSKANRTPGRKRPKCRLAHAGPCVVIFSDAYSETEPLPADSSVLTAPTPHVSSRRRVDTPPKRLLSEVSSSIALTMDTAEAGVSTTSKRRRKSSISKSGTKAVRFERWTQELEFVRRLLENPKQRCTALLDEMGKYTEDCTEVEFNVRVMRSAIAGAQGDHRTANADAQRNSELLASARRNVGMGAASMGLGEVSISKETN